MSKEKVLQFFTKAAEDEQLKRELQSVTSKDELVGLGQKEGFQFSPDHVEDAIDELKQQPGFFRTLAEAVLEIFSPEHDNYPTTGTQPFSGEPNRNR
ncbi:MAG: Nif11-like leader peptide family natural product precursor [Elainellaceae cyanobacterium]